MKKILAVLLTIVLLSSTISITAFADVTEESGTDEILNSEVTLQTDGQTYTNIPLNYNRDVFIYLGEDMSVPTNKMFSSSSGYDVAFSINQLELMSGYSNGVITFGGVPYQLGPIGTKTEKSTTPNALYIAKQTTETIDVLNDNFKSIKFIANENQAEATVATEVKVYYVGESTPVTSNITRISSFRAAYTLAEYEKYIGQIKATRGDNSSQYGSYPGYFFEYSITTDPTKIVDKITVKNSGTYTEVFIYSMTGVDVSLAEKAGNVVTSINALPDVGNLTYDNLAVVQRLRETIDAIIDGGYTIDETAYARFLEIEEKMQEIVQDHDEIDVTIQVPLKYTRDVFVTNKYQTQSEGYISNMLGSNYAMLEETLQALNNFHNGALTFNGIDYKFGPLGTVDTPSTEKNAVHSGDGKPIVIDVPKGLYSKISFIANNSGTAEQPAVITYTYTDGTISVDSSITRIISYRQTLPSVYNSSEAFVASVGAIRFGGYYPGNLTCYTGTVDQTKILSKVTINSNDSVVYSMTGVSAKSRQILSALPNIISGVNVNSPQQTDRDIVFAVMNEVSILQQKGISDDKINSIEGLNKIFEVDKKLIRVTTNETQSSLDKIVTKVDFSGPVNPSSITKENIKIYKNNVPFSGNYDLVPIVTDNEIKQIQVVVDNEMDYTSTYKIVLSANIVGQNGGLALNSDKVIEYVTEAPVAINALELKDENGINVTNLADVKGKNLNFNFKFNNNTIADGQDYAILVAIYSPTGRMETRKVYSGNVLFGENVNIADYLEIPNYVTEDWTLEVTTWDSYQNCKKIYNTIIK